MTSVGASDLSPEWAERVQAELEAGERLLWAAQPLPVTAGQAVRASWLWMLFALFWFGFAFFIHHMTSSSRATQDQMDADFDKKFQGEFFREARERRARARKETNAFDIIPWIGMGLTSLIGLVLLLAPVWTLISRRRARERTCYALTDRNALVWAPCAGGTQVQRYSPEQLRQSKRIDLADGTGDLVFEEYTFTYQVTVQTQGGGTHQEMRQGTGQRGFLNIPQVREVERLLRQHLLGPHQT